MRQVEGKSVLAKISITTVSKAKSVSHHREMMYYTVRVAEKNHFYKAYQLNNNKPSIGVTSVLPVQPPLLCKRNVAYLSISCIY